MKQRFTQRHISKRIRKSKGSIVIIRTISTRIASTTLATTISSSSKASRIAATNINRANKQHATTINMKYELEEEEDKKKMATQSNNVGGKTIIHNIKQNNKEQTKIRDGEEDKV